MLLVAAILTLSACDSFQGVSRVTRANTAVPHECIGQALTRTAGVKDVKYLLASDAAAYQHHFYDYEYKGMKVRLAVLERTSGSTTISHQYLANMRAPPQSEIDRVRPLMAEVERSAALACTATDSLGETNEECRGVKCEPLPLANVQPNLSIPLEVDGISAGTDGL